MVGGIAMRGTYTELRVWQQAMELARHVYRHTQGFPKSELYGLVNQMRRAAVSVPSNIAEGKGHRSNPEFTRYLYHARGSLLELETQIRLSMQLQYLGEECGCELLELSGPLAQSLNALIHSLDAQGRARDSRQLRPTTNDERLTHV
jgi:four helix bundle protein